MRHDLDPSALQALKPTVGQWARELGFADLGFSAANLDGAEEQLMAWLDAGYHGDMDYMARHGANRARPAELVPGTHSILTLRMNYLPGQAADLERLASPDQACVARYALGRDYHKLVRNHLQKLADRLAAHLGPFQYRAFSDSAPVMEVDIARRTRLGWRGKHTLLLTRQGSWFFLGELFTDLPFPADPPHTSHCGDCQACIDICPTRAILAPYRLDARRCISYLTIEHPGSIPVELRPLMGNRIYGCDDCQLVCPWNRFAQNQTRTHPDFLPRNSLDNATLLELFAWNESEFQHRLEGSPIRRIGHERWLRNLAVGLGNAPPNAEIARALQARLDHPSAIVREHLQWALSRHPLPS
ncbi:MAG: tRNA epoxyqueuosine(34) reductase QueG [Pseudomonadota bacterium]